MKKLFTLLLLLSTLVVNAQWFTNYHEADALKELESYTAYVYVDSKVGSFIFWDNTNDQFRLINKCGMFNVSCDIMPFGYIQYGASVLIGFYNENDSLQSKEVMWLEAKEDDFKTLETVKWNKPIGQKRKVKKILKWLETDGNYIRIIADTYGGKDFDLIVKTLYK